VNVQAVCHTLLIGTTMSDSMPVRELKLFCLQNPGSIT